MTAALTTRAPDGVTDVPVSVTNPMPASDTYQGEVAMVVGTTYPAGKGLKLLCSAAGTLTVVYANGTTGQWAVGSALTHQTLPISITQISASTATATYSNLM